MKTKPLTPQFRDALTMSARRGDTYTGLPAEDRVDNVLSLELERALLERDYLEGYLEWIEVNLFNRVYPRFEPGESVLRFILTVGLSQLKSDQLHCLALDPIAMLGLRERIHEEMPDYWWGRLKELAPALQEEVSAKVFWKDLSTALERDKARKQRRLTAVGSFRRGETSSPRSSSGCSWSVELPIERATIEFTLRHIEQTQILEVRLFGPLRLSSSVRCAARLLTRDGKEVSRGVNAGRVLTLPLPTSDVSGLRLECDWSKGGDLHWRFEAPVLVSM